MVCFFICVENLCFTFTAGAFAANIARGLALDLSIQRAIHVASLSVTRKGSQKSYFSLSDISAEYHPPPPPVADPTATHTNKLELYDHLLSS
jgi:hypothetical protein